VTVSKSGNFCNIYVGDGLKRGGQSYSPIETPEVQSDPSDQIENLEPTPQIEPEEPDEPDTDKVEGDPEEEE